MLFCVSFLITSISTTNAAPNSFVHLDVIIDVLDVNLETNLASVKFFVQTNDFPNNYTHLSVQVFGGGSVYVSCENTGPTGVYGYSYQGESEPTNWLLSGTGENYPFNSYTLNFKVNSLSDVGKNFTLDDSYARFDGTNYVYLTNYWKTENVTLLPITQITQDEALFSLEKTQNTLVIDLLFSLAPILGCYYLLGASLILNPRTNLSGRLQIYLSLFVFSSTFFFTLQSVLPFRSAIAFPELLLSNLIFSVAIFGVSSIIGSRPKNPWDFPEEFAPHVKTDLIALVFALELFVYLYNTTLFGKLSDITSLIFSYGIIPSYCFSLFFTFPKRMFFKHKRLVILYGIVATSPLIAFFLVKLIFG